MICYAVIDTNVLVSALISHNDDAATVQVLSMVFNGEIIPVYSNYITKEYRMVLSRKRFGFSSELIDTLIYSKQVIVLMYGIIDLAINHGLRRLDDDRISRSLDF